MPILSMATNMKSQKLCRCEKWQKNIVVYPYNSKPRSVVCQTTRFRCKSYKDMLMLEENQNILDSWEKLHRAQTRDPISQH